MPPFPSLFHSKITMFTTSRKVLGLLAPANTNEATLYTVPAGKSVELKLYINNVTGTAATSTVKVVSGGTTVSLRTAVSVAANTSNDAAPIVLMLSAGDVIKVTSGTANAINFVAVGTEYTAQ